MNARCADAAETLNRECQCTTMDLAALQSRVDVQSHPNLFSDSPVFLSREHFDEMQRVVHAIEQIAQHAGYQQAVLADAPAIAHVTPASAGVFYGYDFHIAPDGPKLIEVNTNAGGAFLNASARDAQIACCEAASGEQARRPGRQQLEDDIVSMFRREWLLARGHAPLRTIAIVDENPAAQFLYPEFQLAQRLFESKGIRTLIADVGALRLQDGRLMLGGEAIDLVYNRCTDFYFAAAGSQALRAAYEHDLAVVTPHPRAHALYANKRNLILLSNAAALSQLGVNEAVANTIARAIPPTHTVAGPEEGWWRDRKSWFFKPTSGFGSKGAYRGDKMTRRVISEIMNHEYVAQKIIPPGERQLRRPGGLESFKVDIRCYVYEGRIQMTVARLYQGQTTNFRSAGGGFAAVYLVDGAERAA